MSLIYGVLRKAGTITDFFAAAQGKKYGKLGVRLSTDSIAVSWSFNKTGTEVPIHLPMD
jgi:hypothetical protein